MENPSLKTRIFKATIGSQHERWIQKEVRVGTQNFKRNIKGKNPSRNPDLKNKRIKWKTQVWKLESSKQRLVPTRALDPKGSLSQNSELQIEI